MCYNFAMQVVLSILSIGLLGLIVYFAISPKSSKLLKRSAIIALGVICLSIGICAFILIRGPVEEEVVIDLPVFQDTPTVPAKKGNIPAIIIFIVILIAIVALIVIAVRKEKLSPKDEDKKNAKSPIFEDGDDLDLGTSDDLSKTEFNDSFDIDF